jgi:hypothetical protein
MHIINLEKIRKQSSLVLNRISAFYCRCINIIFIKSLSFCLTTLTACPNKFLDTCKLHTTRWIKVVFTIARLWVTTALHIHSKVAWTFAPQSCHVIRAATYKQRLHNPTIPFVWLQKEEIDAHGGIPGSLTQRQERYVNNPNIPSKTVNILFRKTSIRSQTSAKNLLKQKLQQ